MTDTEHLTSDNANTLVTTLGGRYYAVGETAVLHEIDIATLATTGRVQPYFNFYDWIIN